MTADTITGSEEAAGDAAAVVKRMFAAFAAGDLDALIETVHPESRWTYYGANPRIGSAEFTGHAQVRRFFERIIERLEMDRFEPREFVSQGQTVVIFGSESGTVRASGHPFHNEWVQKYVVQAGLITRMAEYNIQTSPRE